MKKILKYQKPRLRSITNPAGYATCAVGSAASGATIAPADDTCIDGSAPQGIGPLLGCYTGTGPAASGAGCWSGAAADAAYKACVSGGGDGGTMVGNTDAECDTGNAQAILIGSPCSVGSGV